MTVFPTASRRGHCCHCRCTSTCHCCSCAGTWAYSAPEVRINRQRYTKKVDAWSLGVISFVLLSGYRECLEACVAPCTCAHHHTTTTTPGLACSQLHHVACAHLHVHLSLCADPFDPDGVAPEEELQRNIRYGTVSGHTHHPCPHLQMVCSCPATPRVCVV
jgi:serine/threonine protein kinase